jgi:hypothetical protein
VLGQHFITLLKTARSTKRGAVVRSLSGDKRTSRDHRKVVVHDHCDTSPPSNTALRKAHSPLMLAPRAGFDTGGAGPRPDHATHASPMHKASSRKKNKYMPHNFFTTSAFAKLPFAYAGATEFCRINLAVRLQIYNAYRPSTIRFKGRKYAKRDKQLERSRVWRPPR